MSDDDSIPEDDSGLAHKTRGRFSRFAKISSMTAGFAARRIGTKVKGAFLDDDARQEDEKRMWEKSAAQIATGLGELKGAAMKVGQMLSSDPELLPPEMTDALSVLQKQAPPMAFSTVTKELEDALGCPVDEVFDNLSEKPIGAASIGQVHKATLKDGRDVALKIQYPGIRDTIASDMKNLGSLLNLARAKISKERVDAYLAEVTEVITRESDYLLEADALERFQTVFKDVDGVRCPTAEIDLCRTNVLVMEFIPGRPLSDYLQDAPEEEKLSIGARLIQSYIVMMHDHQALHADPHPGNFIIDDAGDVVFLDLGCVRDYEPKFTDGLMQVIAAMWRADIDGMMVGLDACDFEFSGADPEVVYAWLEILLKPLLEKGAFDFNAWTVHEDAARFMKKNPGIMNFHPAPEALFYLRVLGGLRGIMGQNQIPIDARSIARAAARRRGFLRR